MTIYRTTMRQALEEMYQNLNEDNLDLMRKAAGGAKQTLKMKDGKIGVDSFTASAIMQIYDKINDKNKKTFENMMKNGKKADIMKLQKFAMSKVNASYEEFEEEVELVLEGGDYKSKEDAMSAAADAYAKQRDPLDEIEVYKMSGNKFEINHPMNSSGRDSIQKRGGKLIAKVGKNYKEEVELDEAKYDLYHKDFSTAMQHAYKMAKKLHGITISPDEISDKVATGPRKPSEGKTNSYRLKGDKGSIQVQVYNKGGSKPFELNMYKEEVDLDEVSPNKPKSDVIVMKKGQVEKSVVGASAVKKAEKEGFKIQYALLKTGKKVTDPKGIMKAIKSADKLGIGEEVDLDEASKFSNADFILGFAVPWAKNPTTQYEPHLVNYVKKLAPSGNREYAYKMVAQVVQQLINGGMPAIRQWLQQNKGYYDKMDSKVKKELMKGMKEEVDLDEDEYAALDSFTNSVDLTPEEEAKIAAGPDAYEADEKLMAKLMNHFSDGMPYGTQKGRDGDPYEFIFQELDMMGLIKESVEEAAFGGTIDKMQHIVDTKSAMEINGVMVDTFTASLIMDIFSKVNKDNQDKMRKMPVEKLASAAYKLANRFKEDVEEGYYVMPPMDRERYTDLPGLEGPFQTRSGKVVYYDPKEGKYYDRDSDMYLSYDEFKDYDQSRPEDFKMTVKMPKAMQKEDKFDYWQSPNSLAKLAGIKERSLTKAEKKR